MSKKFFTLFCTIAIALCTSAVPFAPKAELAKKAPVAVEQMQKVQMVAQFEQTPTMNLNQLSAAPALKVTNQKAQVPAILGKKFAKANHKAAPAVKPAARKLATGDPTVVIIKGNPSIQPAGSVQIITVEGNDNMVYAWGVKAASLEAGKTYTFADMDMNYTYRCSQDYFTTFEGPTDATFSIDAENNITASMVTESGTYMVYTKAPQPSQDINVTAVDWYYDDYYYDVYLNSETETYLFELQEDLVYGKTYTLADMYSDWVCTLDEEGYPKVSATDATLTVSKDEAGLTHIAATMVLNGDKHVIAYDEKPFEPSGKQINVNGTDLNGRYMSYYGFYLYTATWGDYTVQLAFDATEEKAAYTNDEFLANYGMLYSDDDQIQLFKLASESITITNTETTKTLAGSIYAKNGDEYILNLVYEKPAAKEIFVNVANADLTTKMLTAGFWTIGGTTADKNNSVNIYFISKALQGTFTDVAQFDAYSTWVSDKSTGTTVYYENLSAVNLTSVVDGDSLKITGTMNLADDKGNPAIVTVHITTPFAQEWGDWADFAPFDVNTGKYTFTVMFSSPRTLAKIPVQERKDNTGLKQYQFLNLGKGYYGTDGINMTINMTANRICTIQPVATTIQTQSGSMNIMLTDAYTLTHAADYAEASYYDPEEGKFNLYVVAIDAQGTLLNVATETMVMDKPITERDTVDVVSTKMTYDDFIATNQAVQFYAGSDAEGYTTFLVTSKNASTIDGTFDIYDGYCFADSTDGSRITFAEGKITIVKEDDVYHLTGWAIGSNEKYYRLDWTEMAGVLEYDADAPFNATFAYSDMSASIEDGVIGIYATNAKNQTIGLELYTNPANTTIPEGTYVISDLYEAGTALKSVGVDGGYLTECWAGNRAASGGISIPCWFMVEGTVTLSYDEYGKLKVVVDAKNSYGQPVTAVIAYEKLDPKSEVTIEADNMTFTGTGSMFLLDAANTNYEVVLMVMSNDTTGTYSVDDLVTAYSGIYSVAGQATILDGEFTLALDGKKMTLIGSLLASDTIQYNLNITGYMGALPYDQNSDYTATFELEDALVRTDATETGMTEMQIINDYGQIVWLGFFAEADGNKLPAGTYPINSTKAANTVLASVGVADDQYQPSFAGILNAQGNIAAIWFMVDGEVVVAEDGSITVNAVNSLDKTITITITKQQPTDLPDVNENESENKFFQNGKLIILKANKKYHALGAEF